MIQILNVMIELMRVKVRNPLHAQRHLYASHQPEWFMREGEQVTAPKWAVPGTIALTTGEPDRPVRLIDPELIISINDEIVVPVQKISEARVITVQGSKPGATYAVTIAPEGSSCTCSGFVYRKSCRHISMAA